MKRSIAAVAVILLGSIVSVARERIQLVVGDLLVIRDHLAPADVIYVISGPDHRTDYAIRLYQQGYGTRLFFVGGWCPVIQGNNAE